MVRKRFFSVILASAIVCTSLAGCSQAEVEEFLKSTGAARDTAEIQETVEVLEAGAAQDTAETQEVVSSDDSSINDIPEEFVGKLEEIAKDNGISLGELNVKINDEGYVTFLGNSYTNMEIKDEDDALLSLEEISDLIGLEGISLSFYGSDVSPITGNTYYTFYQVDETEIDGKSVPVEFYNNLIKVAVDKNGKAAAISTFLNHEETDEVSTEDILDKDEVTEFIKSVVDNPEDVVDDATKLVYWDDKTTASAVSSGKKILAYLVYIKGDDEVILPEVEDVDEEDENAEEEDTKEETKEEEEDAIKNNIASDIFNASYTAVVVSALKYYYDNANKDNYAIVPITSYKCCSIEEFDDGEYTSLAFFEGKEDAGEYTYTLSLDWVKDAYADYAGPDSMDITVSVMYDKSTDLYYLADYNRRIVMANYFDFDKVGMEIDKLNTVVSKTPEDLNSWGFLNESNEEYGIEKFIFDPNYVFGVYNNMVTVYDMYNTRYGFKGVDYSEMPILSLVYTYNKGEYPEKPADFEYNASCGGQFDDWEYILTSPALAACISPTVMGHEFTHGVNQQLTSSQYMNQPGALMESYADIIGEELAILYANDPIHTPWVLGDDYCEIMRDFGHPQRVNNPRYVGGADYIPETTWEFAFEADFGGVHTNSGVTNYLAYRLTHEEEVTLQEGEEILAIGDNLDMWFETLFLATYVTDFNDVAHFLTYTSTVTGLTSGQKALVDRLIKEHGLLGSTDEFEKLLSEEEHYDYTYVFEPENDDFFDRYDICVANIKIDENNNPSMLVASAIPEDGKVVLTQSSEINNTPVITVVDKATGEKISTRSRVVTNKNAIKDTNLTFHIKEINLTSKKDDKFVVPEGEVITQLSKETDASAKFLLIDGEDVFTSYGKYFVFTQKEDAVGSGELNIYLITVAD